MSDAGNLYASTLVRLRPTDPSAPCLALLSAVALQEAVHVLLCSRAGGSLGSQPSSSTTLDSRLRGSTVMIKWPNDLLLGGAKLAGILLERSGDAVVIGFGVNCAHHPALADRPTTSLADHGLPLDPAVLLETLAEIFARWLDIWRGQGIAPIRARWLAHAHAAGSALTARLPDGSALDGLFDGLDPDGALRLRLADGTMRVIHAADVFPL